MRFQTMSTNRPNSPPMASPPPPHQHVSPPPYDILQPLNSVKEDAATIDTSSILIKSPHIDDTKEEEHFVKKKLLYHLQTRPKKQELVNLNILRAFDQDPSLRAVMDNLMKQRLRMLLSSRILDKKLSNRKSIQSLIREGILKESNSDLKEDNHSQVNRRDMYRRMSNHSLTEFLSRRPTLQELVKANMVQDVMTWTKITCSGTIPRPRNCHQMCLNHDDSALYVVGGFNTGSVSIDLLKFDITKSQWSRPLIGGPVPTERYSHSVVNVDSNLVVFGGFSVEGKWLNDLHALDTEYAMNSEFQAFVPRLSAYGQCKASTNNSQMLLWYPPETTGTPPSPRAAHAAAVVGKKMYIFGGNNQNILFNDLHCLDTENMKWSLIKAKGTPPSKRSNHSLTAIGDKMLIVFGGNDGQPLNDIHIFDIEKNSWTQPKTHGTPPLSRGGHSAVCVKNKQLLIFAGGYNSKILNDLYILDVETMTWIRPSDTGMLPEPRAGHSCCVTKDNVVYICGGGDSEDDKLFNDLYQLDTGYFTTDEKQISKLIYAQNKMSEKKKDIEIEINEKENDEPYTMNKSSYEYNNGNFSQSNFHNHIQHFIQRNNVQYGNDDSPLMQAGVISDDISAVSSEIDTIIQTVENGIKRKMNEFKQKEEGYLMIMRSIEAERRAMIDDVNRDVTMLKFSVKESLDKLQQKFIAKMLRKHVDYVNATQPNEEQKEKQPKKKQTLVRSPLIQPALGIIEEEESNKDDSSKINKNKVHNSEKIKDDEKENSVTSPPMIATSPPIPANAQSPNPTLPQLQQQQLPTDNVKNGAVIGGALTRQAQFQKDQMAVRQFIKQQEYQKQQKLQQIAQQAMQKYIDKQEKIKQNENNNSFWQKNARSNQYRGNENVQSQPHQQAPNNGQHVKKKKKRRRSKKKKANGGAQSSVPNIANNFNIPNVNVNMANLMQNHAASSMSPPGYEVLYPNGIGQNGMAHQNGMNGHNMNGMNGYQYNHAHFPNINPATNQPLNNKNGSCPLNPNAMSYH